MSPISPKDLERVIPRFHGSLCDEITKLGQFDILIASFMNFFTDGCVLNEGIREMLCDNDCESTTSTTTLCLFDPTTTTSTTSTTTLCPPPDAPVLTMDSSAVNNINISYTSEVGAQVYEVWRSLDGAAYVLYATRSSVQLTYQDTACPTGHTYAYKVLAFNESCGDSAYSNIVSVTL